MDQLSTCKRAFLHQSYIHKGECRKDACSATCVSDGVNAYVGNSCCAYAQLGLVATYAFLWVSKQVPSRSELLKRHTNDFERRSSSLGVSCNRRNCSDTGAAAGTAVAGGSGAAIPPEPARTKSAIRGQASYDSSLKLKSLSSGIKFKLSALAVHLFWHPCTSQSAVHAHACTWVRLDTPQAAKIVW